MAEYQRQFPSSPIYSKEALGHISEAASQTHSGSTVENQRQAQLARWAGTTKEERMEHYRNSFGSEKARENLAVSKQAYWDGPLVKDRDDEEEVKVHYRNLGYECIVV